MRIKIDLYLAQSAKEVWLVDTQTYAFFLLHRDNKTSHNGCASSTAIVSTFSLDPNTKINATFEKNHQQP